MQELILGMTGFILAIALFELGRYRGIEAKEDEEDERERFLGPLPQEITEEITEEEKRERARLIKDINAVFNYGGRKGGIK